MATQKKLAPGKVLIEVVSGVEGPSLYVGDPSGGHRLAGPKPWGGGRTVHSFTVDAAELRRELDQLVPATGATS